MSDLQDLIRSNKRLEAIVAYREQTGAGLREAKDYMDALERQMREPNNMPSHSAPAPTDAPALPALLAGFAENLTERASSGSYGDTFQRDAEINQVLQALASPLKGRVAVIGPARAGKTAVILGLTARMASGACPPD